MMTNKPERETIMNEQEIIKAYKAIATRKRNEKRAIRIANMQAISAGNKTLETPERYPILLADPPWQYSFGNEQRNIQINYPTMRLEDIHTMPIDTITTKDALLFLWATSPKLHEAMSTIEAWGFEYKSSAVWVKSRVITGYYFRAQHELLLIATKGKGIPTPLPANRPPSVINAKTRAHSQKPDEVYEIIEKMYPELPKCELFARNTRKGWFSWGNEV